MDDILFPIPFHVSQHIPFRFTEAHHYTNFSLFPGRGGVNIKTLCAHLHKDLLKEFKYALCWGQSCKHAPQRVGKDHELMDEDVVQVFKKTAKQYGMEKKGKVLTKQGVLAEPKKEVDKKDKRGPSSNRHDGGPAKNTGKMGKSAGFA